MSTSHTTCQLPSVQKNHLAKRNWLGLLHAWSGKFVQDTRGQGTLEYAILVGILVVIAIGAITLFSPKIEELWTAISDGINGL